MTPKSIRLTGLTAFLCLLYSLALTGLTNPITFAHAATPNFVQAQNGHLTFNGQNIVLKGQNYYPRDASFAYFWEQWDSQAVRTDLSEMATLGENVVRILIPYGGSYDWNDSNTGVIKPEHLDQLRQFVQMAGAVNLRVIITLFDFYGVYPNAGWDEERANFTYLNTIVSTFANDDRVLAWDLHNEPENYVPDFATHPDKVLNWLARMREAVRKLDVNHLITVGSGHYDYLWLTGGGGFSMLSLSDFVSLHSYNALDFGNEIVHIREHTDRPIVMEETGWPTGPVWANDPNFNENTQTDVYTRATKVVHDLDLAGLVAWNFSDHVQQGTVNYNNPVDFYGLQRLDGSLKPAAAIFHTGFDATKLPLPATQTNLPLTQEVGNSDLRSQYFPQTGKYISTPIKEFWRHGGDINVFGLPVTNAFPVSTHAEDPIIGQYFEKALVLYHSNRAHDPKYGEIKGFDKYLYIMDFEPLGLELFGGRNFKPLPNATQAENDNYKWFGYVGHDLSQPFYSFWRQHFGMKLLGPPISQPLTEADPVSGRTRLVQYFEKGQLEIGPDGAVTNARLGILRAKQLNLLTDPGINPNASAFYDAAFERTWQRTDTPVQTGVATRTWLWGPQGFAAVIEPYQEAPNGWRLVEYFDKTRMEISNPSGDQTSKYFVSNGLLAKEMMAGQIQVGDNAFQNVPRANIAMAGDLSDNPNVPTYAAWATVSTLDGATNLATDLTNQPVADTINKDGYVSPASLDLAKLTSYASFQAATKHNIPAVFWDYMTKSRGPVLENGLTVTGDPVDWAFSIGLPLSEAYWTRAKVGGVEKDVLVQAFERRVLTYTPTNDAAFQVEMGNVGRAYYQWRYGTINQ